MGLLGRIRGQSEEQPWHAPALGMCTCAEHVENLVGLVIGSTPPVTVGDLVTAEAVSVDESPEHYLLWEATGQRRGPFHWRLGYTHTIERLYDADAPASIDDMLFIQGGIDNVMRIDRTTLAVGAPTLCTRGVSAAFMTALTNPRVRREG